MSTAAIAAQGATLHIAGTSGAAKTITAAVVGNPTVFTSVGHGLANGDSCAIAAIVGTLGTNATKGLNGKTVTITNVTADTFAVQLDSTGLVYTSGGTATPSAWIKVGNIKTIKASGATSPEIDVTDLDSTQQEFKSGIPDPGSVTLDNFCLDSDAGQAAMLVAFNAQTVKPFKVTYPAGSTPVRSFDATVKKFPDIGEIGVNGVITGSIELRRTGAVTIA